MNIVHVLKHWLPAAALMASVIGTPAMAADVGVSVTIGQPGFYGHIDIGDYPYPEPVLIYREPIIIHRHAAVVYEPIYLRVPPGHAKRWRYYCDRYDACDRPVYFVRDRWYNEVYAPLYRERHGDRDWHDDGDRGRGHKREHEGHGRGHR